MNIELFLLIIVVVTALAFDFTNGFHDTGNAMATSIASGALKPKTAVAMSAVLNLVGAFLSTAVAATIARGLIDSNIVTLELVFAGLVGGIVWNLLTWLFGIPSSSSHALIGGIVGAVVAKAGPDALIGAGIWKTVAFIVISPLLGYVLGSLMMVLVAWICRNTSPLGPKASTIPPRRSITRSQAAAIEGRCVITTVVTPAALAAESTASSAASPLPSRWVLGSSRTRMRGLP